MSHEPPIPIELWEQVPPPAQEALRVLHAQYQERIGQLQAQVRALQVQVADLAARLNQNSTNSSKPPSSDGLQVKRRPPQARSGRTRGAQPGHARQQRPLLPPTQIIPCKPSQCRRCGEPLAGDDPQPLRHQVLDLPEIKPQVLEYQRHRLTCPGCGTSTCGPLPPQASAGGQGPRLQALVALLTGAYRLSKRQVEQLLADLVGLPLSSGQVCATEQQLSAVLEPVVAELREQLPHQNVNMDETGWWEGRRRTWLWVAVTQYLTVYELVASRGADVVEDLLAADFTQTLTSDRLKSYNGVPLKQRQVCWAHLLRDFQAMIDRDNEGSAVGDELLFHGEVLFELWAKVRDGTRRRRWLRRQIDEWFRADFRRVLEWGAACGCAKTAGTCAEILKVEEALWTFTRVEGVEPTNNAAERALRHAVLWRKLSHGTESARGSRYVANILSVVETCRQQGRNVLEFLTTCCERALTESPLPSLLPQPNS